MSRAGAAPARGPAARTPSRRAFLQAGALSLGGGAALALAACGGGGGGTVPSLAVSSVPGADPDVDVLNRALELEQAAIAAYAGATGVLRGRTLALARTLLAQEMAHADTLTAAIGQLGGSPHEPRKDYTDEVGVPRDAGAALRSALRAEQRQIDGYVDAVAGFVRPALRATAAAILTDQAEHVALLRRQLGLPALAGGLSRATAAA